MWGTYLTLSVALAAPPSTALTGPDGTLSWTITESAGQLTIEGTSPKWTVTHTAALDFTPRRTVHRDAEVGEVTIDYTPEGATVTRRGKTWTVRRVGLWDGDTLDVRLGANVAEGRTELAFHAIDPASGKVYSFDAAPVASTRCGAVACTEVKVQLTGVLRLVGPTWSYWYTTDGRLVRFEGPAGSFSAW